MRRAAIVLVLLAAVVATPSLAAPSLAAPSLSAASSAAPSLAAPSQGAVSSVAASLAVASLNAPPAATLAPRRPARQRLAVTPAGGRGAPSPRAVPGGGVQPAAAATAARGDFNGDGFGDLAIGVPGEDLGSARDAGAVNVLYGSNLGLGATGAQAFWQGISGLPGTPETNDLFGAALAAGDFDGDHLTDLAVGVLGEDFGTKQDAGIVEVLHGSSSGLIAGPQLWSQDSAGVPGLAEDGDAFGSALCAGDFDGDGKADLAIGVPDEGVGRAELAGAVNVLFGAGAGLVGAGAQQWTQDGTGIAGQAEAGDFFGDSLAAGDFANDGTDDLAVGAPGESIGTSAPRAGVVHVLPGGSGGPTGSGSQLWRQGAGGVPGTAEAGDFFGEGLAAGDFDGDLAADLAVGVLAESLGGVDEAGVVNVLYGVGSGGLSGSGSQLWSQDSPGVGSGAEAGDLFGQALVAGDFDGDGRSELAVGVPGEDVGHIEAAGAVNVLEGSVAGLTGTGSQLWYQGHGGLQGVAEAGDGFGLTLAAGNVGDGGRDDLAVGVPFEGVGTIPAAGAVQVLYGVGGTGLRGTEDQLWTQDSTGVPGNAEPDDGFGAALG